MTPRQVKEFTDDKECDFAIGVPGIGRFRVQRVPAARLAVLRDALDPLPGEDAAAS